MILNTTEHISRYPESFKKKYYKNFIDLRKDFTNWVDSIGQKNNLDWWVSIPASRNQYISQLYSNFCLIETLKEIKSKNSIEHIIVESQALKKIIEKNLKVKLKIIVKKKKNIKNLLLIVRTFFFQIIIHIFCKFISVKKLSKKKKLILIDTFIIDEDLNNNKFYHKELIKISKEKNNIFFVPTFAIYSTTNLVKVFKTIFRCSVAKNFLLREQYLNLSDILNSFLFIFRRKKFIKRYKKLKNIDYSSIINNEINQNHNLTNQLIGLQNYSFFKNLFYSQIKIKKVINWAENQSLDKGWNYGSRSFYPKAISLGYQGFTFFPQYMSLTPSKSEYDSKVVPETLLSIGKIFNKTKKEFCKYIKVKTVPALNFQHLFKQKHVVGPKNKSVLIILSGFLQDDINLIKWCIKSNLHKKNIKIQIKEHPILQINIIKNYLTFFPDNYLITKKNFSDSINSSQFLICSGVTSGILEIIIQKRFVIIPKLSPFDNLIFSKLNIRKNFKVLDKPADLDNCLRDFPTYYYNKSPFFTKLTRKNIKIFV